MPRSIEIGFINEGPISAALELIRRTLEPNSTSLPHITLRYTSRKRSKLWDSSRPGAETHDIVLEGPITFDNDSNGENGGLQTIVIACSSDELELQNYKPDFPASILHITLHDSEPSSLAKSAFDLISREPWGLQFRASLTIYESSRSALNASSAKVINGELLTDAADQLRRTIFSKLNILETLPIGQLSDTLRLEIITSATIALRESEYTTSSPARPMPDIDYRAQHAFGQLEFWSKGELALDTGPEFRQHRESLRRRSAITTPPELAKDVAKASSAYISNDEMVDFGDPAVGSGILYAAVRNAMGSDRINSARVVEIDSETARLVERRWARSRISVREGDFLAIEPEPESWSLLLANPPYLRSQAISFDLAPLRGSIHSQLGLSVSGRADLFVYFILRAHEWLQDDAIAAWIIPSEFQVTSYGKVLRDYLSSHVTLLRMHTYDSNNPIFDNALTSTSVIIYRKTKPLSSSTAQVTYGDTMDSPLVSKTIELKVLGGEQRWSMASLRDESTNRSDSLRLADLFELKRGIATGANSYFVLSAADLKRLNVHKKWVRQLAPAARQLDSLRVEDDDASEPYYTHSRWVIDTSEPIDTIREESSVFAKYLEEILEATRNRYLISRRLSPFLQEKRLPPKFLFLYMAKSTSARSRFILNNSNATYLNNYIGMYPTAKAWDIFQDEEALHASLLRVSNSELERWGRVYGNGLLKLEPRDLANVRISS